MPPRRKKNVSKKQEAIGSNITNRSSTLRNDIAKALNFPIRQLPPNESQLRNSLLTLDGMCEYCEIRPASKGKGDHFYSVILKGYPSEYCDDLWNLVPACSTCNSSKGGRHWELWLSSKSEGNPILKKSDMDRKRILTKFENYDRAMQKHCQPKDGRQGFFQDTIRFGGQVSH